MKTTRSIDPLGRGPWWAISGFIVTSVVALLGWVYFFVLNRTRIVRPFRGTDGPNLMLISNHQSPVDTVLIVLAAFFPQILFRPHLRPWSAAAAEYWFRHRAIAWLADRLRCLPARTGRRDPGTLRTLCRVLPTGITVFFPEGKRSRDGRIGAGKSGAGFIALRTGARIVPVAIDGLLAAMPHDAPRPRIGKAFTIAFGDPVPYADLAAGGTTREAAQAIVDRSLAAVTRLHESLSDDRQVQTVRRRSRPTPFTGKVVWLTGASSGIGRALALALHDQSATLIISSRNTAQLESVARECTGDAPVHVLPLDLTDADRIPDAVRAALNTAGPVDYVFHNAGLAARATTAEASMEVDRQVMETNFFGPVALTKAILPSMIRRKAGTFVVVSSITGRYGVPRMGAYSASKHALHGFFESLRAEVAPDNIHVSIAVPGFINTAITLNALTASGARYGRRLRVHLQGMSPQECARRILNKVASGRREFLVGGVETLSVPLLRISRTLVAFLIRHHPFRFVERIRRTISLGRYSLTAEHRTQEDIPSSW